MHAQTHIIGKQHIKLEIDSRLDAFAIQQDVSWILRERILPRLERLFDELAPKDSLWRIDKLELFLEELDPNQLETQLTERVIEAIRASILHEQIFTETPQALNIEKISLGEANLGVWFYFLEHGTLPWWQKQLPSAQWEDRLQEHLATASPFAIHKIRMILREASVRKRLLWQFAEPIWQAVFQLLQPAWIPSFRSIEELLLYQLPQQFRKQQLTYPLSKERLWDLSLEVLIQTEQQQAFEEAILLQAFRELAPALPNPTAQLLSFFQSLQQEASVSLKPENREAISIAIRLATSQSSNLQKPFVSNPELSDSPSNQTRNPSIRQGNTIYSSSNQLSSSSKKNQHAEEGIFIQNAGLVLLHPFFSPLFEELGYLEGKTFSSQAAQFRAVHLLQYLASGELDLPEYELTLNKFLCGMPINAPVPGSADLSEREKEEADRLLRVVIGYWKALRNTTPDGLRFNYLMREGKLMPKVTSSKLQVEKKTQDVLMNKLPWGVGMVQLSWMQSRLSVEWAY